MSAAAGRPVVAMVGAGQLARMTHQAAIPLGIELRVLAERADDPAVLAGATCRLGAAGSLDDVRAVAAGADALTFDHEAVPPEDLAVLTGEGVPLAPPAAAKRLAQDKLAGRRRLAELGFPVPAFAPVATVAEVEAFAAVHGWPLVLKAARGGYDGRGVLVVPDADAAAAALRELPGPVVVEPRLALERELAVLVARTAGGERVAYPVVETVQRDGMCREVLAPAPVAPPVAADAEALAVAIADAIGSTGVLAVELFLTADGLSVNELALRPHNSGHFSIEGCGTSQFEQHLRAVLGWPLGRTELRAPAVATVNVVGPPDGSDPAARLAAALAVPGAHVHLYGKRPRPGRKLGHVTALADEPAAALAAARRAAAVLEGRA